MLFQTKGAPARVNLNPKAFMKLRIVLTSVHGCNANKNRFFKTYFLHLIYRFFNQRKF
jgi:hypothetical protein